MIRVYVGSDVHQRHAEMEAILHYSIFKHASEKVEVHFMCAGDNFKVSNGPRDGHWNLCREPNQAWPKFGHGTDFSVFRMAVPEYAGFTGKAIYLDVDMIVLGDIAELWRMPQKKPYLCNSGKRTEVALIDCAAFQDVPWWPRIAQMQPSGVYLSNYRSMLAQHGFLEESLPWEWNSVDKMLPGAKLIHYSAVPTQPWHPYKSVQYSPHPDPAALAVYEQYRREALG